MPNSTPKYQHFLITRFNLVFSKDDTDREGQSVHSHHWIEHRLALFERFCLPSVLNQQCTDFVWLILIRKGMEPQHLAQLQRCLGGRSWIQLVEVPVGQPFIPACIARIQSLMDRETEYVLTTRMDNDDMIRDDFIKTIQGMFQPEDILLIDLVKGWQLGIGMPKGCLKEAVNPYNPFITLVEKTGNIKTVFAHPHNQWPGKCEYASYRLEPLWVEIVHERNKDNRLRSGRHLFGPRTWKRYGLVSSPVIMETDVEVMMHHLRRLSRGLLSRFKGLWKGQR